MPRTQSDESCHRLPCRCREIIVASIRRANASLALLLSLLTCEYGVTVAGHDADDECTGADCVEPSTDP